MGIASHTMPGRKPLLVSRFEETYEVLMADTPELLDEVYRLRFHVLCIQEKGPGLFAEDYPDGRETDEYDQQAVHCLLRHRPTGKPVGTARLILTYSGNSGSLLPIERDLADTFYPHVLDPRTLPRGTVAEISRLIITRAFWSEGRLRKTVDAADAFDIHTHKIHPILGIIVGLNQLAVENGVRHLFGIMKPSLVRMIAPFGLRFHPLGPIVNYHGLRQPHMAIMDEMRTEVTEHSSDLFDIITQRGRFVPQTTPLRAVGL